METLSAIDLIVIMIDVEIVKERGRIDDSVQRLNVVRDSLLYRIIQEIHSRPSAEIEAALKDLKAIESNLAPGIDHALMGIELVRRAMHNNL